MKRYSAAQARQRLSELLDAAESKQDVVIERHGVQFSVQVLQKEEQPPTGSHVAFLDPIVEAGEWTWEWTEGDLRVVDRARTTATAK